MKSEISNNELKVLVKVLKHSFPDFLKLTKKLEDPSQT